MNRFGEKLRTLRQRHGMTLKQVAKDVGIKSHSYISALETSQKHPSVELAIKIAKLFGVTIEELLNDNMEIISSTEDAPNSPHKN